MTSAAEQIARLQETAISLLKKHDEKPYLLWVQAVQTTVNIASLEFAVMRFYKDRGLDGGIRMSGDYPEIYIKPGPVSERAEAFRAFPGE